MFMDVTPVLSADWFGSVDDNNHIADSRWAHTVMPTQVRTTAQPCRDLPRPTSEAAGAPCLPLLIPAPAPAPACPCPCPCLPLPRILPHVPQPFHPYKTHSLTFPTHFTLTTHTPPHQRDKLSSVKNSYGIIRSYWNNNPDPEVRPT